LPQYLKHQLPEYLVKYDRETWSRTIDWMKPFLKAEASPGVPCAKIASRNDLLLSAMGERFNDIVLDRVENILSLSLDQIRCMERRVRIDSNLVDPVRVFVKNEPHKVEKLIEGRVRLIMSVSLTDKMIEMLLSRFICKNEITNWCNIPSKPGIGFTADNNTQVYNDVMSWPGQMAYADVSGWDWGVKAWQIEDEAETLIRMIENPSGCFTHLILAKALLESESVYQFSDGLLVQPTFKGIVNSGKYRTSRGNSFMRVRVADLIGSRKVLAAGDDSVEAFVENAKEAYASLGIRLKEYEKVDGSFEFCSHLYKKDEDGPMAYSLNAEKMMMNLLHTEPQNFLEYKMFMIGFQAELETHPDYEHLLFLLESVGFSEVEGPHYI